MKGLFRICSIIVVTALFIQGINKAAYLDSSRMCSEHKMLLASIAKDKYYSNRIENDFVVSGSYKNGLLHGVVNIRNKDEKSFSFIGEVRLGVYDGHGRIKKDGKLIYQGSFSNGEYSGWGIENYYEKDKLIWSYEGNFNKGHKNGFGKIKDENGNIIIEGLFDNDMINKQKYFTLDPIVPNITPLMMEANYNDTKFKKNSNK